MLETNLPDAKPIIFKEESYIIGRNVALNIDFLSFEKALTIIIRDCHCNLREITAKQKTVEINQGFYTEILSHKREELVDIEAY